MGIKLDNIAIKRLKEKGYKYTNEVLTCSKGHSVREVFHNIKLREYRAKIGKTSYEDVCSVCKREHLIESNKERITGLGYSIVNGLPEEYHSRKTKFWVLCSKNHKQERTFESICEYPRCHQCFKTMQISWFDNLKSFGISAIEKTGINSAKIMDNNRVVDMTISQICTRYFLDPFEIYKYTKSTAVAEEVTRADRLKFNVTCEQGHSFTTSRRFLLEGHGCKTCSTNQINEPEQVIGSWIENAGFKISRRTTETGNGELDIYCEERGVAIEYCGIKWHSMEETYKRKTESDEMFKRKITLRQGKHQAKTEINAWSDIHVITVFESDYLYKRQFVKDIILDALAGNPINSTDFRYRKMLKTDKISEPQPHYFDRKYREVEKEDPSMRFTVYDCGHYCGSYK